MINSDVLSEFISFVRKYFKINKALKILDTLYKFFTQVVIWSFSLMRVVRNLTVDFKRSLNVETHLII